MKKIISQSLMMLFLSILGSTSYALSIRFATEPTYPPFEYVNASGQLQGFDIDLAKALCQQMKADCSFSMQGFSSLIPGLKLGKYDAIIASVGITDERLKQVNFTTSYYQPSAAFVAATLNHYDLASLVNKTIGVQAGSTFELYLRDVYANKMTVKTYASVQEAFLDLAAGRVDAVLADTPIVKAFLAEKDNSKKYSVVERPITDKNYFGVGYGIAVNKNNPALLNALNKALTAIKADGTYEKLVIKYFGN